MSITYINTYNDFYGWNRTGIAVLNADIVLLSSYNADVLSPLVGTFDGNGKTISIANGTFSSPGFKGLFHVEGGTVQNLNIDIGTNTMYSYYGIVNSSATGYGTISKVAVVNNNVTSALLGGITCFCYNASHTLNVNDCSYTGYLGTNAGGVIGPSYARGICNVMVCRCYVNATVKGSYGGGLVGGIGVSVPSIDQCIVKLRVNYPNVCGGFLGNGAYSTTVSNSYVMISSILLSTNSAAFAYNGSGDLSFTNCYCLPAIVSGALNLTAQAASTSDGILTYTNVASYVPLGTASSTLVRNNTITNYTSSTLSSNEPIASFDATKWDLSKSPPILSTYTNWSGYTSYNSIISIDFSTSCLLSGTLIKLEDGTFALIQDIVPGQKLWGGVEVVKIYNLTLINIESNFPRLYKGNYLSAQHAYLEDGKWHHPICSNLPKVKLPQDYLTWYHLRTKNYFTDTLFLKTDDNTTLEVETYADEQEHESKKVWDCSVEECVLS